MTNFIIYKEGKYDYKANLAMKLDDYKLELEQRSIRNFKAMGEAFIRFNEYFFKELGKG